MGHPLILALVLACASLLPFGSRPVVAQQEPVAVIVGASSPIKDISMAELRSCFRGRRVKVNGVTLIPFNMPVGSHLRSRIDRALLGLEPQEVGRFWVDARIRDQGEAPRTAPTEDLAVRVAAALRGAITYVRPVQVTGAVRMVTIDGRAPGDPGYPLND